MSRKKEDLGKGIRSLLQDIESDVNPQKSGYENSNTANTVINVPLELIEVNPFQPRLEFDSKNLENLANSIKIHGLIQPITLRKLPNNKYQLIVGERRLRATKMAGMSEIKAYIRQANNQEMLEIALVENIQREDLNAIEISINYKRLLDECGLKHEELADRVGKDRTTVTNYLRLLKLPPEIQMGIKGKKIHMGHARSLINIESEETQLALFHAIVAKGLSVRMVERMVKKIDSGGVTKLPPAASKKELLPGEYLVIRESLRKSFGAKVNLKHQADGKGEIIIPFSSDEDLNRLLSLLENK